MSAATCTTHHRACACIEARRAELKKAIRHVVDNQSAFLSVWFQAATAPEAYLQEQLRDLHRTIELWLDWEDEHD